MPNSQAEYPLTLAEVLFDELEATCADLDETQLEFEVVYVEGEKRGLAIIRAIMSESNWDQIEKDIEEIKELPTFGRKEIETLCQREGIAVDFSRERLSDVILKCKRLLSNKLVPELYKIIRGLPNRRAALCLSGGGVRSAVFNLGILQGLARSGLLDKFDYLSTVSGGGFIGGWLSAWIHREEVLPGEVSVTKVASQLARQPEDPLKPEPPSLYKLRVYANYLTPRKGLLSADTWTLVAVYLRNLFLNWLVFVPVIMGLLMIPRIWMAFIRGPFPRKGLMFDWKQPIFSFLSPTVLLIVGFIAAAVALIYIAMNLPAARKWDFSNRRFLIFCLTPLVISALALTTYWASLRAGEAPEYWKFILFAVALASAQWIPYVFLRIMGRLREHEADDGESFRRTDASQFALELVVATALIAIAFAITGFLTGYIVVYYLPPPLDLHLHFGRVYASLSVPVFLILLSGGGTLIAGFTSRFTNADDQEWWARAGAWILIVSIVWVAAHLVVLFGPSLFTDLQTFMRSKGTGWAGLKEAAVSIKGVGTAVVGVISGIITIVGGKSSKVPANGDENQSDWRSTIGLPAAAVVFAVFIAIVLALITNWILASPLGEWTAGVIGAGTVALATDAPKDIIYQAPGRLIVLLALLLAILGWIFGRVINTNRFSLHYYWRNRMMRAYLGVSRHTEDREKTRDKFTDFDQEDDVQMYELKQKPLHVVNVALNLAGGSKLEWQDRKAESFTISPLHSGSYWLGYRSSRYYGGNDGISLATSVAISGAAASPNMGYMMTSPFIRFIMALFNVRLGFWLGNPGVAGSGSSSTFNQTTFDRDSPTQSVRPIFAEALGLTNDHSPYVYLSDGGHFDNFGLYEMILRRCRFIVVSDASTDPEYTFESLAYSIRQIRVDFGIPIEMDKMHFGKEPTEKNKYCATGKIRYSCVDRPQGSTDSEDDYDGVLIYIKPSLDDGEPADVANYHKAHTAFPQDTIVDQWFSESQFESYRMLGSHMIEKICPKKGVTLDSFLEQAREYLTGVQRSNGKE
jgi:Patatin-like phospholipase